MERTDMTGPSRKRVLVTGSAGPIGSHASKAPTKAGDRPKDMTLSFIRFSKRNYQL
jgi:hypothetical protein